MARKRKRRASKRRARRTRRAAKSSCKIVRMGKAGRRRICRNRRGRITSNTKA